MKALFSVIIVVAALAAGPAYAAPDRCAGRNSPQRWISIEAAAEKAELLGYSVKEAKRSNGCWKIEGYDRHGAEIEIYFDGESGDVVTPNRWRRPAGQSSFEPSYRSGTAAYPERSSFAGASLNRPFAYRTPIMGRGHRLSPDKLGAVTAS